MPSREQLIVLGVFAVAWALFGRTFNLWLQCRTTGVRISFWSLLTMRRSLAQRRTLVQCSIACVQAGSPVSLQSLMDLQDSGHNLTRTVRAFIQEVQQDPAVRFDDFVRNRAVVPIESTPVTESSE